MTSASPSRERILAPTYAATTVGMFSLIVFVAFEAMAVATVMPTIARALDGVGLFALSFAAPLASGVVGMVVAGMWSDRSGPTRPLLASLVFFSLGLLVCGTAPSMAVLVAGRVVQGLGGGALVVGLYVVVGRVYPARLQPSIFAAFAAAWVLPALFGPALAALVADTLGWRWVFLLAIALVGVAAVLISPGLRRVSGGGSGDPAPRSRLAWATLAAVAVLGVELLGSGRGLVSLLALVALGLVVLSLTHLLPAGTLVGARGLPAVIATRGLLSAAFFCAEAFIVFVLQEQWDLSPGRAGISLTLVGVVWAAASQVQARLGERVSDTTAMRTGTALVLAGIVALGLSVRLDVSPVLATASYVLSGAGMGFGYPRTSVAMLAASSDRDRGFNSSALTVADSLGAALALAVAGVVFAYAGSAGLDPFVAVFTLAAVIGVTGTAAAARTRP
jgi:MFS family permease